MSIFLHVPKLGSIHQLCVCVSTAEVQTANGKTKGRWADIAPQSQQLSVVMMDAHDDDDVQDDHDYDDDDVDVDVR